MMFLNRARIVKKAVAKGPMAKEIITQNMADDEHWLVYCEDGDQLSSIACDLRADGVKPFIYISDLPDGSPEEELRVFKEKGGVLLSIRCLDEGIDIPVISHAVIIASSQNPRQFIQRRGRVLRKSGFKTKAVVYDIIVSPSKMIGSDEKFHGLITSEMRRALEFAKTSMNSEYSVSALREFLINLNIAPDRLEEDDPDLAEVDA